MVVVVEFEEVLRLKELEWTEKEAFPVFQQDEDKLKYVMVM